MIRDLKSSKKSKCCLWKIFSFSWIQAIEVWMNKAQPIPGKEITWSRMNLKEVISELPYPIT
jgi:hypothetical protein